MKVLKTFLWNKVQYAVVELDSGLKLELRSSDKLTEKEWTDKAKAIEAIEPDGQEVAFSDIELLDEVKSRGLAASLITQLSDQEISSEYAKRNLYLDIVKG